MIYWKNLDSLTVYDKFMSLRGKVDLAAAMSGRSGAERVAACSVPMPEGLTYNFAAKAVDGEVMAVLSELAKEHQLVEKYEALYNGAVINTGEKRLVLHHLCRGQLGEDVFADGVNKRAFYTAQQGELPPAFACAKRRGLRAAYADTGQTLARCPV